MEASSSTKDIDSRILLAPVVVLLYLVVVLENYFVENTAFSYIFQM